MSRIAVHEEKSPMEINVGGESKWICMCGLSSNRPFCNGAHKQAAGEEDGKIYKYENGERVEVRLTN